MPALLLIFLACGEIEPTGPIEEHRTTVADIEAEERAAAQAADLADLPAAEVALAGERKGTTRDGYIAARHIIIGYEGSGEPHERSKVAARKLAEDIHAQLLAGEDFAALARKYSDGPSAMRGGDLGSFTTGAMVEPFEDAAFALEEGGISGVVESPFGFHLIQRYPLQEVRLVQLVARFNPADDPLDRQDDDEHPMPEGAALDAARQQALARAEALRQRVLAGEDPAVVASDSDGPMGVRGGDVGWFQRGQMAPRFDRVAFDLEPGEVSEPIESRQGYHVLVRVE